ncbi:MAG: CRTAC1 family protein [Planctomycetaceae bacterium]
MNFRGVAGRSVLALGLVACVLAFEAIRFASRSTPVPAPDAKPRSALDDCRVQMDLPPAGTPATFTDVTEEMGLDFRHVVGPLGTYYMPESIGAGGALFDYDGDGRLDVYLVNCGRSPDATGEFPPGTRTENRLYRQTESGTLEDVTAASGLGDTGYGAGCAIGDVDNDGRPDVYIANYGADRLYANNGDGTFTDVTEAAGIRNTEWGVCPAFFDYDRDGLLDLVVVNYTADPVYQHSVACGFREGTVSYCGPHKFLPTVDRLFHNDGVHEDERGRRVVRFSDVTDEAGLSGADTFGFGVICADFDRDGWPDVFVANDGAPNRLWMNQRDGTFREEALLRGVALNGDGKAEAGMGTAVGDVDGDGAPDLIVTHLSLETTTLYRNDGNGYFVDATAQSGVDTATLMHTGWGAALVDLDHDGSLDLPLVHGLVVPCHSGFPFHGEDQFQVRHDVSDDPEAFWRDYHDRNRLLFGDGRGGFRDAGRIGGDFCAARGSGRALISGDLDDDGDVDFLVTNCGGPARLYRNDLPKQGHWLRVRAVDPRWGRDAYGAEIVVKAGDRRFHRLANPAYSYLASNDARVHFGIGDSGRYDEIVVHWPDGPVAEATEAFPGGLADHAVTLRRGEGCLIEDE